MSKQRERLEHNRRACETVAAKRGLVLRNLGTRAWRNVLPADPEDAELRLRRAVAETVGHFTGLLVEYTQAKVERDEVTLHADVYLPPKVTESELAAHTIRVLGHLARPGEKLGTRKASKA